MASKTKKRRDLEIVCNLQWKTRSNGDGKQATVIGVCDVPQTTLHWDLFRSYILKHSGTTDDDMKISYMSEDGEVPIESQHEFQIALYAFRKKARNGDIITLWLDRATKDKKKKVHSVLDAQTQASGQESESEEMDAAPEWFNDYMRQFRQEVLQEVKVCIAQALNSWRTHAVMQCNSHPHVRKSKQDCKRTRKCSELSNERDLLKSLKLERKLETKLEKLERKTLKLKEKSLALTARSSDSSSGAVPKTQGLYRIEPKDLEVKWDAQPVAKATSIVPHMSGGELYVQRWEVRNTGNAPWDSEIDLRLTWGNEALVPVSKSVACPKLKPGEQGVVSVLLQIPREPGEYESYWSFHHQGQRFGHWLGCQIVVDPPLHHNSLFKFAPSHQVKSASPNPFEDSCINLSDAEDVMVKEKIPDSSKPVNTEEVTDNLKNLSLGSDEEEGNNFDAKEKKVPSDDSNSGSDSDNQSIISIADTNSSVCSASSEEYVVVPQSAQEDGLREECVEIKAKRNDEDDNNNNGSQTPSEQVAAEKLGNTVTKSGYAYITIDGKKLAVPKCFLHDEYLATAEDAPDPNESLCKVEVATQQKQVGAESPEKLAEIKKKIDISCVSLKENAAWFAATVKDYKNRNQHLAAKAKEYENSSRLFVFPDAAPGFEVVSVVPDVMQTSAISEQVEQAMENEYGKKEEKIGKEEDQEELQNFYREFQQFATSYKPPPASPPSKLRSYEKICSSGGDTGMSYSWKISTPRQTSCPIAPASGQHFPFLPAVSSIPVTYADSNFGSCVTLSATRPRAHSKRKTPSPTKMTSSNVEPVKTAAREIDAHLIRENLVTGAVNVASSAINTAKSVLHMIVPQKEDEPGKWVNGHWVTTQPKSEREAALNILNEMGFNNRDYNATLLSRYGDNIEMVIADLLATK